MKCRRVQVLDCTLRDGGYCNNWEFGFDNVLKIISNLVKANIDIVECGFLTNKILYEPKLTRFSTLKQIESCLKVKKTEQLFVAMINFGEYDVDTLPDYSGGLLQGFRIAFHKKDCAKALRDCEILVKKGYKVFVQPMVSMSYSKKEFIDLICKVNEISPYAFYIVDSFGSMKQMDLDRLCKIANENLEESIYLGFHSHNNMQLAYSNAQFFINFKTNLNLIVDCSVYGMGRGAGNLNTELFIDYLNTTKNGKYKIKPLLDLMDEVLNGFYEKNYWGYSLPNYISALYNAHPNYSSFFNDKKTMTFKDMNEIFKQMPEYKKYMFDKEYAQEIYESYMKHDILDTDNKKIFEKKAKNHTILLIAPGRSANDEKDIIIKFVKDKNVIAVSINFDYEYIKEKYIFVSNLRRYKSINNNIKQNCIATSNINSNKVFFQVNYESLLNNKDGVTDNAGLMAIKYFMDIGVKNIVLAGFDGYSYDSNSNYANNKIALTIKNNQVEIMNDGINSILKEYSKTINISFLTKQKQIKL